MAEEFTTFDAAAHLKDEQDIAFLEAGQEEAGDDPAFMAMVLPDIARARNMNCGQKEFDP
ncbi:DNA-binding protein [Sinimarinibacterium sp. NLF-5-8]|uniref:helix-turn-helix domain-containing transcriptional regulator n=1 Tax=Sinimarinibacterium sp. NLF-5-8 TaxID=2698684 RepID=UPI00137BADF2|nr:XRE family transcriptional regulator [Sinimarinibacterium sp. NLF-5-8]QHS10299.1 XRE family transcriptional regulator [Sinimarinibacterium sp. NLF-5-8]